MFNNFKKKYGQNFLTDKNLLRAIVTDADITKDDVVLEIGAGAGALTKELSESAKSVYAYEIDKELEDELLSLGLQNVEFRFYDFMKSDMSTFQDINLKVVANLPYYITTPIIFKIIEEISGVKSITVMVQKEVAERITAEKGGKDYGVLSVLINYFGNAKITRIVKRQMFTPAPNVDSAVVYIEIDKKFDLDDKAFSDFVKLAFSMRRKTLFNNLSTKFDKKTLKEKLGDELLSRRAETLDLEEFVEMYKKLH